MVDKTLLSANLILIDIYATREEEDDSDEFELQSVP